MKYLTTAILFTSVIQAYPWLQTQANGTSNSAWNVDQFKNFIVFGDSYSDENRLDYFLDHNYTAPPTGTLLPESLHAADGGRVWARYVVQYTNELTLYNYAVDGGSCSSEITPFVYKPGVGLYPDLDGYEVPAFLADKAQDVNIATGGPYFNPPLDYENTVYAIFDGTNDISIGSFFTDSQAPGATLSDFVGCLYTQVDRLYASGGRYFVLFNIMPLELTALFGNATEGGETPSVFWPDKPSNLTDIAEKMKEWTTTLNTLFKYRTPVEVLLNHRYPGAKFALFDVNSLVSTKHSRKQLP